jgi:hypothetical protein
MPISSTALLTIPLWSRQIRDGRHGTGRHPAHQRRSRDWFTFALSLLPSALAEMAQVTPEGPATGRAA